MAIVVRYFSTSSAGAGDGTTWADRAAFISGGAISTIITGFDFNSADSLECRVGDGTYTMPSDLTGTQFTSNLPRPQFPLTIHGCDSSGNRIAPAAWNCTQGSLPVTGYPVFDFGTLYRYNVPNTMLRCLVMQGSRNGTLATLGVGGSADFCKFICSGSGTSQIALDVDLSARGLVANCHACCTGTGYSTVCLPNNALSNVRIEGNPSASSGGQNGISGNSSEVFRHGLGHLCIIGCNGFGINNQSASTVCGVNINFCTIVGCGTGIRAATTSGGANTIGGRGYIANNFVANCTTGISLTNAAGYVLNNRLRNTTNLSIPANSVDAGNEIASGSDSAEFVNAGAGDYRIKSTSTYWGKNFGAGDEVTAGSSKPTSPFNQMVIA